MPPAERNLPGESPVPRGSSYPRMHRRRMGWKARLAWLALLVCMVVAGLAARPAWRALRRIRAEAMAREAARWVREEQWTLAFDRARSALQLNPRNPNALRVAANLYARIGVDSALGLYDLLLASGHGTLEDRQDLVSLALRLGNSDLASVHLRPLMESPSPSPRTRSLAAELETQRGNIGTATDLARAAVEADPREAEFAFQLFSLLSRSARTTDRAEAFGYLWPVARTNGPNQIRALAAILDAPDSPRADREQVKALLETNSVATLDAHILRFDVRISLDPSQARVVVDEAIRTLRPASDRELRVFASWLIGRGFWSEALQLLAGDRALRDRGLFLVKHRALLTAGEPGKAYNLLFQPAAPFSPLELEALRCQTAAAMSDARLREVHLNAAAEIARPDVRSAVVVTRLAELAGNPAPAVAVWRKLLVNPRTSGLALRQLAALADLQGDTVGARDFARQIAAEEPANAQVRLAIALNDLLLGENLEAALEEALRQLEQYPASGDVRGLAALGYLRQGTPAKAEQVLQGMVLRVERASPGLLAIVAATYAANEKWQEAQKVLERIPLAALKAEEKELLRPLFAMESRLANPPPHP